jgi:hypothetical protein
MTIFIIIAVLIVALCILVYLFYPKIFASINPVTKNPSIYIQECIQEKLENNLEIISLQGGDYVVNNNDGYFYKEEGEDGNYLRYLCYTSSNAHAPCINQEPFLTEHVEEEILNSISQEITICFDGLVKTYDNKGYEVNLKDGTAYVEIIPNVVSTNFNRTLTLTKGDETETYRNFKIDLNSNLYEMLEDAKNIILWERSYGDSIPEGYIYSNPYIRVEKHRKDNDVNVYVLTDINTEESFRFAVRSFPIPPGIGDLPIQ